MSQEMQHQQAAQPGSAPTRGADPGELTDAELAAVVGGDLSDPTVGGEDLIDPAMKATPILF